ncbi:MAG: hypothetical protein P4L85_25525 [Paludisphaera borealis]|uniref:hypothetical protein n=1 Tax=Paludisphaera borealis TaxID=1387353 RepID=UPI002846B348|nr:hypothetical protein [Paludisphaera borealis]MDR3622739.1 hypothetical protein [Paludisphaera borealis]
MFEYRQLHFARLDRLADPFEGTYPKAFYKADDATWAELKRRRNDDPDYENTTVESFYRMLMSGDQGGLRGLSKEIETDPVRKLGFSLASVNYLRRHSYINCWHMNKDESDAMWKLYLSSEEGIAIKSSIDKLKQGIECCDKKQFIGKVRYIDYNKPNYDFSKPLTSTLSKRKSFQHEHELRVVFVDDLFRKSSPDKDDGEGRSLRCEPEVLIKEIRISPASGKWIHKLVSSLVHRYKSKIPVKQSALTDLPAV